MAAAAGRPERHPQAREVVRRRVRLCRCGSAASCAKSSTSTSNRVELRRLSYMQKMSRVLSRRLWEAAGSPEVDTKRLLVSIGQALTNNEDLMLPLGRFSCPRHAVGQSASGSDAHAERAGRLGGAGS